MDKAFNRVRGLNLLACALVGILLAGCSETVDTQGVRDTERTYTPRQGVVRARMTARTAQGQIDVSRQFYVFPPLQMDRNYQPIGNYSYGVDAEGKLYWISPAPAAEEIRDYIQRELLAAGFKTITFDALTRSTTNHQILVLNPYFSVPNTDSVTGAPVVFVRVTIATYPASLDPAQRREIINQEGLTIYHPDDDYIKAVEKTLELALQNIGLNRDWMQDVSLNSD